MKGKKEQSRKKSINYILIILLAGSILYSSIMISRYIINTYDFTTKNEVALYILWCIILAYLLYTNL